MSTHDQDAEPTTPDGQPPEKVESDPDAGSTETTGSDGTGDPGSHPDPEPPPPADDAATNAGTDS